MLLLAIETSSARGSLAILEGADLVAEAPFPEGLVHGREVTVHLERIMAEAGLSPGKLEALAVGLGPGSYTGIRVGVTAAKTLAFALRIPVIAASSLRVIAANASVASGGGARVSDSRPAGPGGASVVAAVDGKQRHVYLARYRVTGGLPGGRESDTGPPAPELAEVAIELPWPPGRQPAGGAPLPPLSPEARETLEDALTPGAVVVGDAADAVLLTGLPGTLRGPREWDFPRASVLGRIAVALTGGAVPRFEPEAVHLLVPIYLRSSEAERKLGAAK